MYVEADVIISERIGKGVPESALDIAGETGYIYLLAKKYGMDYYFEPFQVTTGMHSGNFVEITNNLPHREILEEGAYSLPERENYPY